MPRAPKRSADSTAFRIARRNATRFSSCMATDSAISWLSSSGFWISWMLMKTSRLVFFCTSCFSLSTSVPLRPMMMPGRLVELAIFSLCAEDDAGAARVDVDLQFVGRALGLDLRDAGVLEARLQIVAQREILVQQLRVVAIGVPARPPGLVEPEPEPVRVDFLTHDLLLVRFRCGRGLLLRGLRLAVSSGRHWRHLDRLLGHRD